MNNLNINKLIFYFFIILVNYLFITAAVYTFSYLSIIKGKTYDWFWVRSIQKKIYFRGYRNILHFSEDCIKYDENLLYKPKTGKCDFSNVEFNTSLNFNEFLRLNKFSNNKNINGNDIVVLGDSIAMGWGVNDNETFSFYLESLSKKKVFNMGVSSYGTVREIKKLINSPYYKNVETIIIQYHRNDILENKQLDINKTYSVDEYAKIIDYKKVRSIDIKFILKNYKSSIRLFFSDILDIIFKEKNLELMNFNEDKKYLEEIIKKNIDLKNKRVIVIVPTLPWQKVINFPESSDIEYLLIELKKNHYFTIDDHPNALGHKKIAHSLNNYLNLN